VESPGISKPGKSMSMHFESQGGLGTEEEALGEEQHVQGG
jgi:hypothetical protein